jgi:hypothetical protein
MIELLVSGSGVGGRKIEERVSTLKKERRNHVRGKQLEYLA